MQVSVSIARAHTVIRFGIPDSGKPPMPTAIPVDYWQPVRTGDFFRL